MYMYAHRSRCLVGRLFVGFSSALLGVVALQASTLWSNGALNTGLSSDNRCDSGPNTCGNAGGAFWTIFDNFNIPTGSWSVTGFDFASFLVNGSTADYQSTNWELFKGDPLAGGKLVASGTGTASLANISGTCGNGNTCLELFTVNFVNLVLGTGTYFLGTTNALTVINSGETTLRAFAAGGNTAPGGASNPLQQWEQSNGSTSGVTGSTWTAGTTDSIFPSAAVRETATAFDIKGSIVPEPSTLPLTALALGGVCLFRCLFPYNSSNRS